MFYAFRIRPLVRLFLVAVLIWLAFTCVTAAKQVPTSSAILLMLTGGLSYLIGPPRRLLLSILQ